MKAAKNLGRSGTSSGHGFIFSVLPPHARRKILVIDYPLATCRARSLGHGTVLELDEVRGHLVVTRCWKPPRLQTRGLTRGVNS